MGRKPKQELQERQLLTESEIKELQKNQNDDFAFNLYLFTNLIYNNIK
jgi:LytS/YehU family sensor histidine kinase